jgi:hypothetical protein
MNERIKELSIQAVGKRSCYMIEAEYIKFAELIVRECGKSCTLQGDEDDMFSKFGIKHFGTEE